jgi:osmotically-inducible protein OsmY
MDELARIKEGMGQSPYPQVREVEVTLDTKGVVILTGKVTTFYMKQMAQETVRRLNGHHPLVNKIDVKG